MSHQNDDSIVEIVDSSVEVLDKTGDGTIILDSSSDEEEASVKKSAPKPNQTIELSGDSSSSSESEGPDEVDYEEEEDDDDDDDNYVTSLTTPAKPTTQKEVKTKTPESSVPSTRESSVKPKSEEDTDNEPDVVVEAVHSDDDDEKNSEENETIKIDDKYREEKEQSPKLEEENKKESDPEEDKSSKLDDNKEDNSDTEQDKKDESDAEQDKKDESDAEPDKKDESDAEPDKSHKTADDTSDSDEDKSHKIEDNEDNSDAKQDKSTKLEDKEVDSDDDIANITSSTVTSTPIAASSNNSTSNNKPPSVNELDSHPMKVEEEVFEGEGENEDDEEEILNKSKNRNLVEEDDEDGDDDDDDSAISSGHGVVHEEVAEEIIPAVNQSSLLSENSRKRDAEELQRSDYLADASYAADDDETKIVDSSRNEPLIEEDEEVVTTTTATSVEEVNSPMKRVRTSEITKEDLPETCSILKTPTAVVYLVGTAHFSKESQDDVARTIQTVQPDVIMVELCETRSKILDLDEETVLNEVKKRNFSNMMETLKQRGTINGILHLLLLDLSARITKELGMAPGGEFRTAFQESKKIPGCMIRLGDRPIDITLNRAWNSLSLWQKFKFAVNLLFSKESITKEEVEKCKRKDLLESMLEEMAGEYPIISKVFVDERDLFLAHSLRMASNLQHNLRLGSPDRRMHQSGSDFATGVTNKPTVVVGVVGIGHVPGIEKNWDNVNVEDVAAVVKMIYPSTSEVILKNLVKYSLRFAMLYGFYRMAKGPFTRLLAR